MPKKKDPVLFIIYLIIGIVLIYFGAVLGTAMDKAADDNGKINFLEMQIEETFGETDLIMEKVVDVNSHAFQVSSLTAFIYLIFLVSKYINRLRLHRKGVEHGSARWANEAEKKQLADKKKKINSVALSNGKAQIDNNIILTNDVQMSLDTRQHRENLNVLVVGGSGSGKTRFFAKPNICQLNTSFVVTDPKGEILQATGKMLSEAGYEVKVFNLINMLNSHNYNPFAYVYDFDGKLNDSYVIKMINVLMKNTKKENAGGGDQFWDDSATALLTAIAFLVLEEGKASEQNFSGVMKKLKLIDVDMNDRDKQSPLDMEFEALKAKKPHSLAVSYYTDFKKAPPETALSIVMSCNVRLQMFNIPDVADLTHTDTIRLNEIGDKKTALFVIISASDTTFNFLAAMMYTQMFDSLYDRANFKYSGRLPVHVRCILDEFANIGTIPDFDKLLATMRSMEISADIIIQNISQLKKMYEKSWEIIKGNCDSFLFLGGQETSTLEDVSKSLGKETIDVKSSNKTKSHKNNSTAENNSILGRELMTPDELARMKITNCILTVRGLPPFFGDKFDIEKHPNYRFLEDADKRNRYDYRDIRTIKTPITDDEEELMFEPFEGAENDDEFIEKPPILINSELKKRLDNGFLFRESGDEIMISEPFNEGDEINPDDYYNVDLVEQLYSEDISDFEDEEVDETLIDSCVLNLSDNEVIESDITYEMKFDLISTSDEIRQGSDEKMELFETDMSEFVDEQISSETIDEAVAVTSMTEQEDYEDDILYFDEEYDG